MSAVQFQLLSTANNPAHVNTSSQGTLMSCSPVGHTCSSWKTASRKPALASAGGPALARQSHPNSNDRTRDLYHAPAFVTVRLTSTAKSLPCCQADPSRMLTVHCPADDARAADPAIDTGELSICAAGSGPPLRSIGCRCGRAGLTAGCAWAASDDATVSRSRSVGDGSTSSAWDTAALSRHKISW